MTDESYLIASNVVTTGHSRSKNGVASLAYDPVVHAKPPNGLPDLRPPNESYLQR
jgi:hypothetical protein